MADCKTSTEVHAPPCTKITDEIAEELTIAVINYIQDRLLPKYELKDYQTYSAMQAIVRAWNGVSGDAVVILLERDSALLARLQDYSERKGCSVEQVTYSVLAKYAEVALANAERDAELDLKLATCETSLSCIP